MWSGRKRGIEGVIEKKRMEKIEKNVEEEE